MNYFFIYYIITGLLSSLYIYMSYESIVELFDEKQFNLIETEKQLNEIIKFKMRNLLSLVCFFIGFFVFPFILINEIKQLISKIF